MGTTQCTWVAPRTLLQLGGAVLGEQGGPKVDEVEDPEPGQEGQATIEQLLGHLDVLLLSGQGHSLGSGGHGASRCKVLYGRGVAAAGETRQEERGRGPHTATTESVKG